MENDNYRYYSLRSLFVVLIVGILMGVLLGPRTMSIFSSKSRRAGTLAQKMQSVMELVDEEYVEKIEGDSAAVQMMDAIMRSLDPHSRYITAEDLKREAADIRGNFEGIGATLRNENDTISIAQTLSGSPARAANLLPGDRIITVDSDTVSGVGMPTEAVIKKIRGPHGVDVVLGIMHYGSSEITAVRVGRDVIPTNSVSYSGMLDGQTGYVRLTRFSETSYDEVVSALETLSGQGMRHLVLDLRDNGGGLLEAAIRIANEFLERGSLIVYTEGAHQRRRDVKADGRGRYQQLPLVIMIDEFSASASEVVSGAVQDNDRGLIVGRRSFGKGLVQRQFDFTDGSAVWLTIARYYTPSGRCIQRPYDKGTDEYYSDFLQQVVNESGADSTIVSLTDTTKFYTTKGRIVYGGGGIYPDHLLPYYHDSLLAYYNQLANRRILDRVAFHYVASNVQDLQRRYPTEEAFERLYVLDNTLLQRAIEQGRAEGLLPNEASLEKYGSQMKTLLRAYVAEYIFGYEEFYKIYTAIDHDLQETIKYIHTAQNELK